MSFLQNHSITRPHWTCLLCPAALLLFLFKHLPNLPILPKKQGRTPQTAQLHLRSTQLPPAPSRSLRPRDHGGPRGLLQLLLQRPAVLPELGGLLGQRLGWVRDLPGFMFFVFPWWFFKSAFDVCFFSGAWWFLEVVHNFSWVWRTLSSQKRNIRLCFP